MPRMYDHSFFILGKSEEELYLDNNYFPSANVNAWLEAHKDRLRGILDNPVIISVHWNNGDKDALVTVMDYTADEDMPFERLRLPFPPEVT